MRRNNTYRQNVYSVTRLNREIHTLLEGSFPPIWLQGEISNFIRPVSGHIYFTLKDLHSQVRCVMFRNQNRLLKFRPVNGKMVLVKANVGFYEGRGEFQLVIEYMELAGDGDLQRSFEEIKNHLFKEGLFDSSHKLDIPAMPISIGVITSPTGAAVQDILSVLARRYPLARVIIYPVVVQGSEAVTQIIEMLKIVEERKECDVFILSRGGGSMEDLWPFNSEKMARAIFRCSLPIVTGIGHEIDFTIADFVSDERAATPSAAAELVSPDQMQIKQSLSYQYNKLIKLCSDHLKNITQKVSYMQKHLFFPLANLQDCEQRLDNIFLRMTHSIDSMLKEYRHQLQQKTVKLHTYNPVHKLSLYKEQCTQFQQRLRHINEQQWRRVKASLNHLMKALDSVSPLTVLGRGYAIVQKNEHTEIVKDAKQLKAGDNITAYLGRGEIACSVKEIFENKKFKTKN